MGLAKFKPLLKQYWKEIGIVALVGMMAYQNFSETRFLFFMETIPSLERRLDIATDNFDTCKSGNEKLENTIKKRNEEIDKWKVLSGGLQKRNEDLADKIADNQKINKKEVEEILSQPTPKTCSDAIDLLRKDRENIKW